MSHGSIELPVVAYDPLQSSLQKLKGLKPYLNIIAFDSSSCSLRACLDIRTSICMKKAIRTYNVNSYTSRVAPSLSSADTGRFSRLSRLGKLNAVAEREINSSLYGKCWGSFHEGMYSKDSFRGGKGVGPRGSRRLDRTGSSGRITVSVWANGVGTMKCGGTAEEDAEDPDDDIWL